MHDITAEIHRRKSALEDIYAFVEFMRPSGHPDFQHEPQKHHRLMLDAFQRVANKEIDRLMIFMPPGGAKSTWLRVFKAWMLARDPKLQMIRVMAQQGLAERQARNLRAAIQEQPFKLLCGHTIAQDVQAAGAFATTAGGFVLSAGVGSTIIGTRAGLAVIDDPVASWEQIRSETQRQAAVDWYFSEYRSRLIPDAPEIVVSTRWHFQDLPGVILDKEKDTWEVIRLPMEAEHDDPLGRQPGERLWPQWYTERMVADAKRDPEIWSGMYQQQPFTSEGDFLSPEDFEIVDEAPDGLGIYAGIDLALSEKQSADATAIVVAGMAPDGTLYILDLHKDRCSPETTIRNLQTLHDKHAYRELLIEDSPAEKVFRDLCHKLFRQQGRPLPLVPMPTRGRDKMARAQSIRGLAKMGAVKLLRGPWNAELIRECSEFPFARHDDVVDALAILGQRAAKMGHSAPTTAAVSRTIQGGITQDKNGNIFTTQSLAELWADNEPLRIATRRI